MTYLIFVAGLALLLTGGELLVRGASGIARGFGISPMVIGLTVVGFGTSSPELLVSLQAALAGQPGLAIGNVIGSNIANILLILAAAALIAPMPITLQHSGRDLVLVMASSATVWLMLWNGVVSRFEGLLLLAGLAVFLVLAFRSGEPRPLAAAMKPPPMGRSVLFTLAGLVLLVLGARFLVDSASEIARGFGISEAVIGLTIVAVGTSLPELATSVIAAFRRHSDIAVGNVLGSNVFNICGILGLTALVTPVPADPRFATIDMPVVMALAIGLTVIAARFGNISRPMAGGMLGLYAVYLLVLA